MSDQSQGAGWWQASDGRWYPPELHPSRVQQAPPPVWQPPYAYPLAPTQPRGQNGCVIALAVVGGLVVLGFVLLVVGGMFAASELDNDFNPAGKSDGVEITLDEFNRIENGMTLAQVERIIGGEGALMSSAGSGEFKAELYTWEGQGMFGANANVSFSGGEVVGKAQIGLE